LLPNRLGVVMVMVSNMEQSVQFYRDVLGLPLRFQSPDWTEFATEHVTLALHGGGIPQPPPSSPGPPLAGRVSTGFHVDDLDAVYADLVGKGVRFVLPPTERAGEGIKLALFADPDGCVFSLAQHLS
jgi:lactoylglutathione lyase